MSSKKMEDDEPPPLEDMTDLLQKLHLNTVEQSAGIFCHVAQQEASQRVEDVPMKVLRRTEDKTSLISIEPSNSVLIIQDAPQPKPPTPTKPLKPLKRGFLNATPKQTKPLAKEVKEEIPLIRPTKPKNEHHKVPEFMRVQDPERTKLQREVKEMLQPTQELVKDVMETADIRTGLEDPEIMAAVSEIAGNPDAMHKFKHNKKVTQFYNQLGKLMKDRIDKQDKTSGI